MNWKMRILADYPGQDAMTLIVSGRDGGDGLAKFVYDAVMGASSQVEALKRLKSGLADLSIMVWELDCRIINEVDEDPCSNVETPVGEQLDGGGEIET